MECAKSKGNDCTTLFGSQGDDQENNYKRISVLEFLNQAGMLLPLHLEALQGLLLHKIINPSKPYVLPKKSGLLGSIFNGLLVNKSPLFGSYSGDNSPTAHQHNTGGI